MQIDQIGSAMLPKAAQPSTADQLEQVFLEEMLKYCGPGRTEGAFSGGAGEVQFASFLTREHAAILASALDLGFDRMLPGDVA